MITYETIKIIAKDHGIKVADLCALAPKNDPFYTGRPSEILAARWFADLYQQFQYGAGVHLRRIHYRIVSQETAITRPDGTLYLNTQRDWDYLNEASKWARYLNLVLPDRFVDRRNPEAILYAQHYPPGHFFYEDPSPGYELLDATGDDLETYRLPQLPQLPNLPNDLPLRPALQPQGYDGIQQAYHLEVWCEKTTMNDVLEPICAAYNANLVTGAGEMSITSCVEFLKRVRASNKPARILYISDFDPAGLGMPISVARKIEFFQRNKGFGDLDISLQPLALTADQVAEFNLPRVPVKDSDLRKATFEANHGEGQVELDALESLYPGELHNLVRTALDQYYDHTLTRRARQTKANLKEHLDQLAEEVYEDYEDDLDDLAEDYQGLLNNYFTTQEKFDRLIADFQPDLDQYQETLAGLRARIENLYSRLSDALQERAAQIDLGELYPLPEPDLPPEPDNLLYDSSRDFIRQLVVYKAYRAGVDFNGNNLNGSDPLNGADL